LEYIGNAYFQHFSVFSQMSLIFSFEKLLFTCEKATQYKQRLTVQRPCMGKKGSKNQAEVCRLFFPFSGRRPYQLLRCENGRKYET